MSHSVKMMVNTIASYLRIGANGIVSIIVTRIALNALGVEDYGLYNLMAGTIALLSFVNSALLISSQRYFSIALGKKDNVLLQQYLSSSLIIHVVFAVAILIILFAIQPILFNFILNIQPDKVFVAKIIYDIMIMSTCVTMLCVPFAALMNAFEDIAALSYINIGSYVIRLGAAVSLLYLKSNLLVIFSSIILLSIFFKLLAEYIWCKRKYKELKIRIEKGSDRRTINEMTGFAGWNTLGAFSVVIRDQGVAIMLNSFFGTAINAAYGIANQVNSLVLSFASNLTTVFAPSIIKAKGADNEGRMRFLAVFSSKMSLILSCSMALPILLFLTPILKLWLNEIPEYTVTFCQYIICCFLITQIYPGINRMIYATGKIKNYQVAMFAAFVSIIPIGIILLNQGFHASSVLVVMIFSQLFVMCYSLYLGYKLCGLDINRIMLRSIVIPAILFSVLYFGLSYIFSLSSSGSVINIISYSILSIGIYLILAVVFILTAEERILFRNLFASIGRKFKSK